MNHFPFLRVANVLRGRLELSDLHEIELFGTELEKLRLEEGDLLIVEGNGSRSEIGRMAIWDGSVRDCVHQNHIIRARLQKGILSRWVEIYWNSPVGSSQVLEVASSTSGLYTFSVSKASQLEIPIPPLEQQERVVQEVDQNVSLLTELERDLAVALIRLEGMRKSLLSRAFTGQLTGA